MADYYCDISAISGGEYQAYAATPTWGALSTDRPKPMDGNGKAGPGHTAAVAITELQVTTNPTNGNTLSIGGSASITAATTAAAKNQFTIGGTIATTVTNLIALLNTFGTGTAQCDVTVNSAVSAMTPAVPHLYYARLKPGTTDTIQLVTRVAGSTFNTATNSTSKVTQTGTWLNSGAASIDFTEGQDGPFAYLINTSTVFNKADNQTVGTNGPQYGLFFQVANAPSDPTASDVVHVRSRRSGVDLSVTWTYSAGGTGPSSAWRSRNYLFDDGTVWSGDNGTLLVWFKRTASNSQTINWQASSGAHVSFVSRSKYNFELRMSSTTGAAGCTAFQVVSSATYVAFIRCKFTEGSDHFASGQFLYFASMTSSMIGQGFDLSESLFQFRGSISSRSVMNLTAGASTRMTMKMFGTDVEIIAATGAIGACINIASGTAAGPNLFEWVGGSIRDTNGVYTCVMPISIDYSGGANHGIILDGVEGITDPSVTMANSVDGSAFLKWNSPEGAVKAYRYISPRFAVDWKNASGFPYVSSAADLRGVNWSHRITWVTTTNSFIATEVMRYSYFYRGSAATKTIKVPLYIPDATTMYQDELELIVSYTDSSDVRRTEHIGAPRLLQYGSSRSALSSDTATWTANGVASHSAKKLEGTTTYAVKSGSEIIAMLNLVKNRSIALTFYASPEMVVS